MVIARSCDGLHLDYNIREIVSKNKDRTNFMSPQTKWQGHLGFDK
jgi:hypothetical protein